MKKSMASLIKQRIQEFTEGQLFATRDFLKYGTRGTVDQTLNRMAKQGTIVKITRGIFMKESVSGWRPSVEDVAVVKAAAFGKNVYLCADKEQVVAQREKIPFDQVIVFFTNGGSGSFWYNDQYVVLKQAPPARLRTMEKLTYSAPIAVSSREPDAVPENILQVDFDETTNHTIPFQPRKKSTSTAAILQFPRWLKSTFSWIKSRSRSQITANSK